MTKKLEELFNLPPTDNNIEEEIPLSTEETRIVIAEIDDAIDKIDTALPAVRDLSASDVEMDELADLAKNSYQDLMDLGMNVDSRFAAEIFSVAGTMLGHALTAKTSKMNKKLKMIDLQLKKMRLDQQAPELDNPGIEQSGTGHVLNRNDLLDRILGDRKSTNPKKD